MGGRFPESSFSPPDPRLDRGLDIEVEVEAEGEVVVEVLVFDVLYPFMSGLFLDL